MVDMKQVETLKHLSEEQKHKVFKYYLENGYEYFKDNQNNSLLQVTSDHILGNTICKLENVRPNKKKVG